MPKIGTPYDEVNGTIIGGNYGVAIVTYEGRQQGRTCYPKDEDEAYKMCGEILKDIMSECGDAFFEIYPLDSWRFNLYGV